MEQRVQEWFVNKVNASSDEDLQGISNIITIFVVVLVLWLIGCL